MRALLIEDDVDLAHWLLRALASGAGQDGFRVEWANDAELGERRLATESFDCVVLDLGLPGIGGETLLKRLRAGDDRTPILVLTANCAVRTRVDILRAGADDFLAKPFAVEELEARLQALVRRSRGGDHPRMACGPLLFDPLSRRFMLAGVELGLTPREHAALKALIQRSGEPLSKQHLADRVFDDEATVNLEAIEVIIHRLRKKLAGSGIAVATLRGLGYSLETGDAA